MPQTEPQNYLDPKVLSRIRRLDIRTRMIVEGYISGLHRSPYQGFSVEFAQHREYVPGDDIRHIDWKVYSKTDRFFIKQFEEETNLRAVFLVDCSESMRFRGESRDGPRRMSKFDYAASLTAALASLLLRQQDAVGLITFDEQIQDQIPPSAHPNTLKSVVHALENRASQLVSGSSFERIAAQLAERYNARGIFCLIGDLLTDEDRLFRGLKQLTHRGHDVIVLQVLDPDEIYFPFEGNIKFLGMEGTGELLVPPNNLKKSYLEALKHFLQQIRDTCIRERIQYRLIDSSEHLGASLATFLHARTAMGRTGAVKRR